MGSVKKKSVKRKTVKKAARKPVKRAATKAKASAPAKAARKSASKKSASRAKYCKGSKCKSQPVVKGYCRLCYIKNWKKMQQSDRVKAEEKLNSYVDKLVRKFPKDYLSRIKEGLSSEGKFQESLEEAELETTTTDSDEDSPDNEFLEKFARDLKLDE